MARCPRYSLCSIHQRDYEVTVSKKYRFEVKVSFMEDERIQIVILQGSQKGSPIAKGVIEKLPDASRTGFIEMVRQLDGGKITQIDQHSGQQRPDVR